MESTSKQKARLTVIGAPGHSLESVVYDKDALRHTSRAMSPWSVLLLVLLGLVYAAGGLWLCVQ